MRLIIFTISCVVCSFYFPVHAQRLQCGFGLSYSGISPQQQRFTAQIAPDRPMQEVLTPLRFLPFLTVECHPSWQLLYSSRLAVGVRLGMPIHLAAFLRAGVYNGQTYQDARNYVLLNLPFQAELFFVGRGHLGGFAGIGYAWLYHRVRSSDVMIAGWSPFGTIGLEYRFRENLGFRFMGAMNYVPIDRGGLRAAEYYWNDGDRIRIYRPNAPLVYRSLSVGIVLRKKAADE